MRPGVGSEETGQLRLLLTAAGSGSGKTLWAAGLLQLFREEGWEPRGLKVGPDYIDPGFLELASGRAVQNLDLWLSTPENVRRLVAEVPSGVGFTLIEGVMGYLDGPPEPKGRYTTAEVAELTQTPTLLIINAAGMGRSTAAVAKGFQVLDSAGMIQGVLLNQIGSERHRQLVTEAIVEATGWPVFGYLPKDQTFALPSRHLGLVPAQEGEDLEPVLAKVVATLRQTVDLDGLLALAATAPALMADPYPAPVTRRRVRVGVARDLAFSFYYPSSLEALTAGGAELVFFSPLQDPLPPDLGALYLGGGFPEVFARPLAGNLRLRRELREWALEHPIYAECGGLMYLSEALLADEEEFPMVGLVPGRVSLGRRLNGLGYRSGRLLRDNPLGGVGTILRGHEFHYSQRTVDPATAAYELENLQGQGHLEGYASRNLLATYLHLDLEAHPEAVAHFLARAQGLI